MLYFKDYIYPFKGVKHTRNVVRCVLLDENNKVVLELLSRDDGFGYSKYVETPGGGVNDNEDFQLALKREVKEELGYIIEIIRPLEIVEDYYNLIGRKNINHYYLAKIINKGDKHLEEHERIMFQGEVHLEIDAAIEMMETNFGGVGELVKQRELPILKIAKEFIKEE